MLMVAVISVQAQDEPSFTLSGSVDTYYRANLNAPNKFLDTDGDGTDDYYANPGTSFANLPGFSLGMINLIASYEGEKVGFVADVVVGPRGSDAVFGSDLYAQYKGNPFSSSSQFVNQLYTYWNVSDGFTLTLGNFNTFLGYEVISPTANYNYSTSYMFSYGPFSHSGLKADIALGDASLMLGVFNDTDVTDFNPNNHYYGGAQLGIGGQYLNLLFSDDYFQVDFTGGFDVSDATFLGINATYNNDLFYGAALYLQQSFTDDFSMGIRGEYFQDAGLGLLATDDSVIDFTLSANYSVGSLTFIPEVRLDAYSDDYVITDFTSPTDFEVGSSLAAFTLAAVYSF
ncbi:outer membrane beta-barrel protein [Marinoscillum sp.]|uniref:outer membrane beta-barrel protein n=1 Tax=Marinoscillum sp. TaxID=2024838 RepID=UPI003BACCB43